MLPVPRTTLLCLPLPQTTIWMRIFIWVLVATFVVILVALGNDPALALGVALAAVTAVIGDLIPIKSLSSR